MSIDVQNRGQLAAVGRPCRVQVFRAACAAARDGVIANGGLTIRMVAVYDVLDLLHGCGVLPVHFSGFTDLTPNLRCVAKLLVVSPYSHPLRRAAL